ncbi:Zn-ribbon domain-containing OB-fold protein [Pseudonocardia sp. CA-107938]|uniref:Zn-ribbon domain-containing OB-fold protein n=1 Tax=Pseudonocardia sp. CA-107938 TaxID=3240021 RepID=UPI003D913AED
MSDHVPVAPADCAMSAVSEPFWQGLAAGRLVLPFCAACRRPFFFPRRWCPTCWSADVTWTDAGGGGTLYARCQVDVPFDGRPAEEIPYSVALVDLDEGVRIPGRLRRADAALPIGERVVLDFAPDPAAALPVWRRA